MLERKKKLHDWGGRNKAKTRLVKLQDIISFKDEHDIELKCLTLAGSRAVLERMLKLNFVAEPKNIITVQTYKKKSALYKNKDILDRLIKTRNHCLGGMRIWPHEFSSFTKNYNPEGCSYPGKVENRPLWAQKPYLTEMDKIVKNPVEKLSILDIDFCGIFNEANSQSVVNLMENKVLADHGLMFITHQKGRDYRGGKLFDILISYLNKTGPFKNYFDDLDTEITGDIARYLLIPSFYMCKAYDCGYLMKTQRVVEYRDRNLESGVGVSMLQYFFEWQKVQKDAVTDELLIDFINNTINYQYRYDRWID